jgi:hypothetical protein
MKTKPIRKTGREGSALFTVMLVIFAVSALVATMVAAGAHRTFMAVKLGDRIRALAIAEAGANEAYCRLAANFNMRTNAAAFPLTSFGGGTYDVTVTPVGSNVAVVSSAAVFGTANETVVLDVRRSAAGTGGTGGTPGSPAYGFAICAGGTIDWNGCGTFSGGAVIHANNNFGMGGSGSINADIESCTSIKINGNSCSINGDGWAPSISDPKGKITGTKTVGPVPTVTIPDINLDPYYQRALANGQVYNSSQTLSSNFTPPGGIMWVNGSLTINANATVTGCFIATGDISFAGQATQIKVAGYPALVSKNGRVKFTGGGTVNGLVYARIGGMDYTGGGTLNGSIIVKTDFKKGGNSTVINYVDSTPIPPTDGTGGTSADKVGVSAWQK